VGDNKKNITHQRKKKYRSKVKDQRVDLKCPQKAEPDI